MVPIIGIDPGPTVSGVVVLHYERVKVSEVVASDRVVQVVDALMTTHRGATVAIECLQCFGMAVGKETFETAYLIGRLMERFPSHVRVYRGDVKMHLCRSMRAKDANIRQALLDLFGGAHAIGKKKNPGPLYGVRSHCWSALAVAVTARDGS